VTAEWLVALEATADEGVIDVDALARRLGALGECRPEAGSDRYVVVLRQAGKEPLDALRGAVTRFEEAAGTTVPGGAHLVGARLVSGKERRRVAAADAPHEGVAAPVVLHPGGGPTARPLDRRAALAAVAVAIVVLVAGAMVWRERHAPVRPSLTSDVHLAATDPHNLLTDRSFDAPVGGPRRTQTWGSARVAHVDRGGGGSAEQVQVAPGATGGIFAEAAVEPGVLYTQSVLLRVVSLETGKRVEVVIEWYDAGHGLVGYDTLPAPTTNADFLTRAQTVRAPSGAAVGRFLVNATGGATFAVADADVVVAPPSAHPTRE
jgi:hypothetical protein